MINLDSIPNMLLYTTTRLEIHDKNDEISIGTGFFYNTPITPERNIPMIITNKHVVENGESAIFRLHLASTEKGVKKPVNNSFVDIQIVDLKNMVVMHPNPEIDLCAIFLGQIINKALDEGKDFYYTVFSDKNIYSDEKLSELNAIEDVFMIGYPIGLWDEKNNFPIIRKGITSSHPFVNYNGKSIGLIDIGCFEGSSGSPVLIGNFGSFSTGSIVNIGSRLILLGVLFAGPVIDRYGEIKTVDVPTKKQTVARTSIPIHLGYIIKAKEIITLSQEISKIVKKISSNSHIRKN